MTLAKKILQEKGTQCTKGGERHHLLLTAAAAVAAAAAATPSTKSQNCKLCALCNFYHTRIFFIHLRALSLLLRAWDSVFLLLYVYIEFVGRRSTQEHFQFCILYFATCTMHMRI